MGRRKLPAHTFPSSSAPVPRIQNHWRCKAWCGVGPPFFRLRRMRLWILGTGAEDDGGGEAAFHLERPKG